MKNVVFWDIKTQFVLHRRPITSPLQSSAGYYYVRFEVFTALTMKNVVFWDIKTQFVLHGRHICLRYRTSTILDPVILRAIRRSIFRLCPVINLQIQHLQYLILLLGPPVWSSGQNSWLQTQRSRVRFPPLSDLLSSNGSGTGSTQPREDK
jgi:hypothetical protein